MPTKGIASLLRGFGKPVSFEERIFADPMPDEVLVRIQATGVCPVDLHAVDGDWPIKPVLPRVPGHEGVGVVTKAGANLHKFHEGDRVGLPWLRWACGECDWCLSGWETLCLRRLYSGYSADGTFSEYVLAPAAFAVPIPERLESVQAAPILCAGVTSWKALKETETRPGEWIAILGTGRLGELAIQYADAMGLHVVAVDIDPHRSTLAKDLGAEITMSARDPDAVQRVVAETGGVQGAIVTAASLPAIRQAVEMTRRKGTCVLLGLASGELPIPVSDVILKRLTIRGSFAGTRLDLEEALAVAVDRNLRSHISEHPLSYANDALDTIRSGAADHIVLTMGNEMGLTTTTCLSFEEEVRLCQSKCEPLRH
jgi:alcohol dehydrogenase, propanol-preferring